ncbi:Zinc finger RING/FYVE/PHD-type protein [Dioscorea alata]|uniref:Zinc finger RING/FYVE/PHD-type protein n=1 Tax=Dioscorea alata TaxID=55571 RepID=A0ACB7TZV0_DIOAL|nr:Zinc finger RING/FYVE/PHD-type protein [Dioscorea alata]
MRSPARFLQSSTGNLSSSPPSDSPDPITVDSDVVVILAALLCALICVVGLALVARCAWLRRTPATADPSAPPALPNKGLKKKALRALPKLSFDPASTVQGKLAECPICLTEFTEGDEIRILPHCGHGFHVACVDTWLSSHSSCPSCRRILVVTAVAPPSRCQRCGACSDSSAAATAENGAKAREDADANRFLP